MKLINTLLFASLFAGASASGASFSECPAVGNDTLGCELLITVTAASGGVATAFTVSTASPDQGTFDGADDTLVGILNSSGSVVNSIALSSPLDIFGFDGDGACSGDYGTIPGCAGTTDPNLYAPAGVTFSGINITDTLGTVNFTSGIANGSSDWFSLEEAIPASQLVPVNVVPEPSSIVLLGLGLSGLGISFVRRRAAR